MKRLVLLFALIATVAAADDQKKPDIDAMMAGYVEMSKPVPEHERLAEMILGGRFLRLDGTARDPIDVESLSILGYDTLGTYYITAAGKHDPGRKAS